MATYQDLGFIGNIQAATSNIVYFISQKLSSIRAFFSNFISEDNLFTTLFIITFIIAVSLAFSLTSPENPQITQNKQITNFQGLYTSRGLQVLPVNQYFTQKDIAIVQKNRVLLNTSFFAIKNAGFLGPALNGSFSTTAIRDALFIGARCFIFSIDYYKGDQKIGFAKPNYPCLLYRDDMGVIRSENSGNIKDMMTIIADEGFANKNSGSAPILIILDFKNTPDPIQEKDKYLTFLMDVANEISVLDKNKAVLKKIGTTTFTNQSNPSSLVTQKYSDLQNKILIFTNADTSIYAQPDIVKMNISSTSNLKMLTHGQIFTSSGNDIQNDTVTKKAPTGITASIAKETSDYWLQTPPNAIAEAQKKTNPTYSIISDSSFKNLSIENCKSLLTTFGVQIIPFQMYTTQKESEDFFAWWGPYAIKTRPPPTQFDVIIPVEPATISKKLNANGGNPTPPKLIL